MSDLTPRFRAAIENMPTVPELALVHLHSEMSAWASEPADELDSATSSQFLIFVRRFVEKHKLDLPLPVQGHERAFEFIRERLADFTERYQANLIEDEIDELIDSTASVSDADSFGYAQLNESEKQRIHGNLQRIRELVEASVLTVRKKNALYQRLNQLAVEVDLAGTKTDRFFAFMGDAAFVLGDMATKAKPFTDEIKDMIKTIGKARSRKEGTALPPGEEVLRLPPPDEGDNLDAD